MKEQTEIENLLAKMSQMTLEMEELREQNLKMKQELLYLRRVKFGRSSERFIPSDPNQLCLFQDQEQPEEATSDIKPLLEEISQETQARRNRIQAKKRRPVRQELPANLERVERVIEPQGVDLDEMIRIGEDIKEMLHYKPGKLWVERIIRPIYKPKTIDKKAISTTIIQAPLPELPISKSYATADLLEYFITGKYIDHLPVYRMLEILKRSGVTISDSTVYGWLSTVSSLLDPLYEAVVKRVLSSQYVHIDESTIPVIDKEKKKAAKSYLWVVRSPQDNMAFFHYDQGSRAQKVIISLLREYQGAIQTDGYDAYSIYENKQGILLLGCWAHARRYFEKALSENQKLAEIALSYIAKLYEVEANLKDSHASAEQIEEKRLRQSLPVIQALEKWMYEISPELLPKSLIGKAVNYTFAMLPRLTRYITKGYFNIDNNPVENTIRPMALGRKNYLFCGNHDTARDAAVFYTLLGCCKMAGVNPSEWLIYVLENIKDTKNTELHTLFPVNWKKSNQQSEVAV